MQVLKSLKNFLNGNIRKNILTMCKDIINNILMDIRSLTKDYDLTILIPALNEDRFN